MVRRIEEIAKKACSENGLTLYNVETKHTTKGLVLLVFITEVGGVILGDCQRISRIIGDILDQEDFINEKFYLEVSSPGLERELKYKMHYTGAIGEKVKITYKNENSNIYKMGILKEVLPEKINIECGNEIFSINFKDIKKAKTYFDYKRKI